MSSSDDFTYSISSKSFGQLENLAFYHNITSDPNTIIDNYQYVLKQIMNKVLKKTEESKEENQHTE